MSKIRTIRLKGKLGTLFGREFRMCVADGAEAVRALGSQLKGFREYLHTSEERGITYAIFYGKRNINPEEDLGNPCGSDDITIMPIPIGNKRGGLFQTILGAALIAFAVINPFGWVSLTAGGFWTGMAFTMGVSLALGGVAQMLSPKPNLNMGNQAENVKNSSFNGPVNTTVQGGCVPIAIGRVLIGSAIISGGVYSEEGKELTYGASSGGNPSVGWIGVPSA